MSDRLRATADRQPPDVGEIADWIRDAVSEWCPQARVRRVRALPGGTSSLVYQTDLSGAPADTCVVKVAFPGLPPTRNRDVLRQARVMRALATPTRSRVPEVYFESRGHGLEIPQLFGMSFVGGEDVEPVLTTTDHPLPDRETLRARCHNTIRVLATAVARLPADVGIDDEPSLTLDDEIDRWSRACSTVDPALLPGWQMCAQELHRSAPAPMPGRISHGDYRLGNVRATAAEVHCVIDWEVWSVSDPRLDLAWVMMFTDVGRHPLARRRVGDSLPSLSEMEKTYEEASGSLLPDFGWFHAFTRFKEAAITALLVKHGRRRAVPPPRTEELAASCPVLLKDAMRYLAGAVPEPR